MQSRWSRVVWLAVTLTCAACGDSGSDEPQELSGVLQAGGAAGVQYHTATRQGVTDANGTFRYLPGETVTFSIGDTELGAVPGAPAISLFTLAGLSPPTTELTLRRELDLTRRLATPLGRAMNMAAMLLALDADGDAANGIDVGARAAGLSAVSLDVNQHLGAFGVSMYRNIAGLTANIPPSQALALLYRAVNVQVPAHVHTRAEWSFASGYVIPHIVNTATYAPDGRRLTLATDVNDDGQEDMLTTWSYDVRARVIGIESRYSPSLVSPGGNVRRTTELDANGYRIGYTQERDDGVFPTREVARFENDANGYVTWTRSDFYNGGDDVIDSSVIQRYTYDARHNVIRSTFEPDDTGTGVFTQTSVQATEYDALSRPTLSTETYDIDADGVVDARYVVEYEYGNGAGATREIMLYDDGDDGLIESRTVITRTFDSAGGLLLQIQETDEGVDGALDSIWRAELSYDDQRRVLSQATSHDSDADGIAESSSRSTGRFDSIGNVLESTLEQAYAGASNLDIATASQYEYGASGELLRRTSQSTLGGLPSPEVNTVTVSSELLADGVLALGQEYLESFDSVVGTYLAGGVVVSPPLPPYFEATTP